MGGERSGEDGLIFWAVLGSCDWGGPRFHQRATIATNRTSSPFHKHVEGRAGGFGAGGRTLLIGVVHKSSQLRGVQHFRLGRAPEPP